MIMTKYIKSNWMIIGLACILVAALIMPFGCKKKTETAQPNTLQAATEVASAAIEQTTCPVEGQPIDKNVFVEYQGKKVYFCCKGCIAAFQKEPDKYIAKLPQFKK